jgi:hypothetical protein
MVKLVVSARCAPVWVQLLGLVAPVARCVHLAFHACARGGFLVKVD